jgi:hypothetical protein
MIEIIKYATSHNSIIQELCDKMGKFNFPDLSSPLIVESATLSSNGIIIGAGFLRMSAEAILIINPDLSKTVRGQALDAAFLESRKRAELRGFDGIHAFVKNNPEFAKVLQNRYKFVATEPGFYLEF